MKIKTLLEMPEIIDQDAISLPLKNVNLKEVIWSAPMQGTGLTLAAHPLKGSSATMVLAYDGKVGDPAAVVAALALSGSKHQGSTVWGVQVAKKARGQRIAQKMYIALASRGYTLLSDDTQTKGGLSIWKALDRMYPGSVKVLGDIDEPNAELSDHPTDPFTDPFSRLVFSLDNQEDIKKSA